MTESARAVFRRLVLGGPTTRPMLSNALGLSKPTMSAAVAELTGLGLVRPFGIAAGTTGRRATVYGLGVDAGYVIGIDVGATQVRALAQTLDGTVLTEADEMLTRERLRVTAETGTALRSVLKALREQVGSRHGPLRVVSVAVPMIVSQNRPDLGQGDYLDVLRDSLGPLEGTTVVLENNVNCAAIAEMDRGAAGSHTSFAYLQVGVKIGLGIVHEGQLFRGANGAAGEIARLPFPWSDAAAARRGALESYLGSHQLMLRVQRDWPKDDGKAPRTARELFERAVAGSQAARRHVDRHAADIGRLAAAVVGVMDPGMIVLGGGVGQNPLLLPGVARTVRQLTWETEIATSPFGNRGSVLGATQLAAREAVRSLVGAT